MENANKVFLNKIITQKEETITKLETSLKNTLDFSKNYKQVPNYCSNLLAFSSRTSVNSIDTEINKSKRNLQDENTWHHDNTIHHNSLSNETSPNVLLG